MDWSDLRHILALGRDGTLAAAARRLGVDQTTVARRLRAAERALGRPLFERLDGTLRPTEAGAAAIAQAAKVEALVASLVDDPASASGPAGLVRVTGVPVLINRLLVPALAGFRQTAPHVRLELLAEPRNLSLSRREADIALRLSRPQHDAAALTKRIGRLDYAVYGPAGMTREDLPWIGYGEGLAHLPAGPLDRCRSRCGLRPDGRRCGDDRRGPACRARALAPALPRRRSGHAPGPAVRAACPDPGSLAPDAARNAQ